MSDTVDEVLDNRGLEPPMPMTRTLEAYEGLAPGGRLRIHNDRVPIYLLPQLEERGARFEIDEQVDGSAFVTITKPEGDAAAR
ncbi:MAG: DUF2249 domain-containing protein [Trueperaceae bacterium]|nr:DUF2249 domain-containing protein [Trueperaceae bacterium]